MTVRLIVNPIACRGFGLCAELFPERIRLDEWGYPIVEGRPIEHRLIEHAERAVHECPAIALRLIGEAPRP
ncbi:MAG: ferredoxin [Candidatus Aeolococcus gillhamiae]|uniref:Ferredoxin n=1 Tax=Candidatus Aeolococcus gillhamiae TaxID=3127015 RepID=A0A2W5Z361_9BACT|nr:MAG: ferredoxin [Candidatus Dormibacter sp. RRmetagenome_bin12]